MSDTPAPPPPSDPELLDRNNRTGDEEQTPERRARFEELRMEAREKNAELMRRLA